MRKAKTNRFSHSSRLIQCHVFRLVSRKSSEKRVEKSIPMNQHMKNCLNDVAVCLLFPNLLLSTAAGEIAATCCDPSDGFFVTFPWDFDHPFRLLFSWAMRKPPLCCFPFSHDLQLFLFSPRAFILKRLIPRIWPN